MTIVRRIDAIVTKRKEQKAKDIGGNYKKDLDELLNYYFSNFETLKGEYEKINTEWKKHCYNMNRTQNIVRINPKGFEIEVAKIISENPQFQVKEETVNFNKL